MKASRLVPSRAQLAPAAFDVVVIGCSAGGLEALKTVLVGLPQFFPVPIVIVQHRSDAARYDLLPPILSRYTSLALKAAVQDEGLRRGIVYVAPAGSHLLISGDRTLLLDVSAKVNYTRPSIDVLFKSVAASGMRAIGVVLTGMGRDGAQGARAIKEAGGTVIVQDKQSADCFNMPLAALATECVDLTLPVGQIARALIALIMIPGTADLFRVPLPRKDLLKYAHADS
jgi:two-component system, chemotaxis family, protein-glutamate methylesterase/glutaminase